jgi:hypothetical protein
MTRLEQIIEFYPDEELLSADGFEDCVIGVACDRATSTHRLVYSRSKCIDLLVERDSMTYEEAEEFFDYNVEGAYMGVKTPIWVDDMMFDVGNEPFKTFDDIEGNDGEKDE